VVLEFLWRTPSDKRIEETYSLIQRYKKLKYLKSPRFLPINLSEETRNKYGIQSVNKALGVKQTFDVNTTCAISFAPGLVKSWGVYNEKELTFRSLSIKKLDNGSLLSSPDSESIELWHHFSEQITDIDKTYEVKLNVAGDGETYSSYYFVAFR